VSQFVLYFWIYIWVYLKSWFVFLWVYVWVCLKSWSIFLNLCLSLFVKVQESLKACVWIMNIEFVFAWIFLNWFDSLWVCVLSMFVHHNSYIHSTLYVHCVWAFVSYVCPLCLSFHIICMSNVHSICLCGYQSLMCHNSQVLILVVNNHLMM